METRYSSLKQLDPLDYNIMLLISQNRNYNILLHEELPKNRGKKTPISTISRRTTKLSKLKLISSVYEFNYRRFDLTMKGKLSLHNLFKEYETFGDIIFKYPVRAHSFLFKIPIQKTGINFARKLNTTGWTEFHPNNWKGYSKADRFGSRIRFTPKYLLINPIAVYGSDPLHCYHTILILINDIVESLEEEFPGLVLGNPDCNHIVVAQHYAFQYHPLAIKMKNINLSYMGERISIDASHGIPELETIHPNLAFEDMLRLCTLVDDMVKYDLTIEDIRMAKENSKKIRKNERKLEKLANYVGYKEISDSVQLAAYFYVTLP